MKLQTSTYLIIPVLLTLFSPGQAAVGIGVVQTFGDDGIVRIGDGINCIDCDLVNGWSGAPAPNEGEEGAGDPALLYDNGGSGEFNVRTSQDFRTRDSNFLFDYRNAGVVAVRFRARHAIGGDEVVLRATLLALNSSADWAISTDSVTIATMDTTWQTYTLSLDPSAMTSGGTIYTSANPCHSRPVWLTP